jgi:aerobic C4-dicarboxylate transport protein
MATATALTNMVGNCVAVFVLAKWERAFDPQRFAAVQAAARADTALALEKNP